MITLTEKAYSELLIDAKKLALLEAAGVDSWEGYEGALERYTDEEEG